MTSDSVDNPDVDHSNDRRSDSRQRMFFNMPIRALLPAALIAVLPLLSACSVLGSSSSCGKDDYGLPKCPVSVMFMRAQPEAMLAPTGAISFGGQADGQIHDLFQGTEPALIATYFATTMSWTQVYEWYESWFAAHRWSPQNRFNLTPGQVSSSQSYDNGPREQFTVGLENLLTIQLKVPVSLRRDTLYQTLFSVRPYQSN